jgi:hypothetical protein
VLDRRVQVLRVKRRAARDVCHQTPSAELAR